MLLVKASNRTYPGGGSSKVSIMVLCRWCSKFTNWAFFHISTDKMLRIRTGKNIIRILEPTEIILHSVNLSLFGVQVELILTDIVLHSFLLLLVLCAKVVEHTSRWTHMLVATLRERVTIEQAVILSLINAFI